MKNKTILNEFANAIAGIGRIDFNTIYNEDCFATMERMQVDSIDVILTSPPYNTSRVSASDKYNSRYDVHVDFKSEDDYLFWTVNLFNHYEKVLKENGVVLYNLSYSSENTDLIWKIVATIIGNTKFTTADCIIWKKSTAIPNNRSKNKLTRICEFVFVFVRKDEMETFNCNKRIISNIESTGQANYENIHNFIQADNNDESNDLNKATFSTNFARQLLIRYAPQHSITYDSFMGTGTTAEACLMEKRSYIGSELSAEQCKYAEKRLGIRIMQPTLF